MKRWIFVLIALFFDTTHLAMASGLIAISEGDAKDCYTSIQGAKEQGVVKAVTIYQDRILSQLEELKSSMLLSDQAMAIAKFLVLKRYVKFFESFPISEVNVVSGVKEAFIGIEAEGKGQFKMLFIDTERFGWLPFQIRNLDRDSQLEKEGVTSPSLKL